MMLFYGYVRGIRSSRKLAAECRENIGFIHLCSGATPDFRTICRFRSENEALLESVFSELIGRLVEGDVVSGSYVIVDGTKVRANASNSKTIHPKFFDEVRKAIDEWMSASVSLEKEEVREKLSSAGIGTSGIASRSRRCVRVGCRSLYTVRDLITMRSGTFSRVLFGNEHVFKRVCAREDGRVFRVYEAVRPCDGCPGRQECLGQSRNKFHKLERTLEHPSLHKYRQRFLQSGYQERLRGRKLIEHTLGHLKHNLGLRRFNLRGLSGARIEAFLAAFASVLRRGCSILSRTGRNWGGLMRMQGAAAPTAA